MFRLHPGEPECPRCLNARPVTPALLVRDLTEADIAAVQRIYAHYVRNALATFEETPPPVEEMITRRNKVLDLGLPYLVADSGGEILGYCYASAYHSRAAYRHTIEDLVDVSANGHGGRGVGAALLSALIARCEAGPWRQMIAIIGDSGNAASIAFAPAFRLRADRDAAIGRLQVRTLGRYAVHATGAGRGGP